MDVLSLLVIFVLLSISGAIVYGVFHLVSLFGVIIQFLLAGIGAWLWDIYHPKYECKVCGLKLASKNKMRNHIIKMHMREKTEKQKRHV